MIVFHFSFQEQDFYEHTHAEWVCLNTPDERCMCQVLMPGSVGFIFLILPILASWRFFWFFLLNLDSTAPNYLRRPLMRSSKAPPNQKNKGLF